MFPPLLLWVFACTAPTLHVQPPELTHAVEPGDTVADSSETGDGNEPTETAETAETAETGDSTAAEPWNIVVVMTDDQRADTLWAMPVVTAELVAKGVTFVNAHTSTPMCCPSRAGLLSGGFHASSVGVLTNGEPNGGYAHFDDTQSLAHRFFEAGWYTALVGKYMNRYGSDGVPYIPPGWSYWEAAGDVRNYYDWDVVRGNGGAGKRMGVMTTEAQYETDSVFATAVSLADTAPEPFLLLVTPHAPHSPFQADPAYDLMFTDYVFRGGAWGEADVSDKPSWVQDTPALTKKAIAALDDAARQQLRMLQSVDAGVAQLLATLDARGILDRTMIVYTSDNGYLLGEHRLSGKSVPYLPAVAVPLVVRAPGIVPAVVSDVVSSNLDLGATFQEVAGLPLHTEGHSLLGVLHGAAAPDSGPHLLQGNEWTPLPWVAFDGDRWRMTLWQNDEVELYDLRVDPHEETNLAAAPPDNAPYADWLARLTLVRPLVQDNARPPLLLAGQPARVQLTQTGGVAPYTWSVETGSLPDGLSINAISGLISGTPTTAGDFAATIAVLYSSESAYDGTTARYAVDYVFSVGDAPAVHPRTRIEPDAKGYQLRVTLPRPMDVVVRWGDDLSFDVAGNRAARPAFRDGTIRLTGVRPGSQMVWELSANGRVVARGTTLDSPAAGLQQTAAPGARPG